MEDTELGDEVGGILSSVQSESFWDDKKSLRELSDSELFASGESSRVVIEVDGEGNLNSTTSSDERVGLEHTLDNTERVVDGSLDLIKEELVGTTDNDSLARLKSHALEEHVFPVTDTALLNLGAGTKILSLEFLGTILDISEGDNDLSTGGLGDTAEIELFNSADGNNASLDEVLEGEVIDSTGAEDDVGASLNDFLATVLADIHLLLADLVELLSVLAENLDTHLEAEFVEVEVDTGDLTVLENLGHSLGTARCLNCVTINEHGLFGGLAVGLQDVHVLNGVLGLAGGVGHLDGLHGVDNHVAEEVRLSSEELGAHGGLGGLEDGLRGEVTLTHDQLLLDEVDRLFEGHTVSRHDGSRVDLVLDEVVGSLEELSGEDDNGGGTVTDLTILDLGELDEDLSSGVSDLKLLENSGAIVSDGHIADIVDEHLVKTLGSERALHNV